MASIYPIIRPIKESDFSLLKRSLQVVFDTLPDKKLFFVDDDNHIMKSVHDGYAFAAWDDSMIAGFVLLYKPRNEDDNYGSYLGLSEKDRQSVIYIDSIAVLPQYRGRGIQRQLMQYVEKKFRGSDKKYWMATISPENLYSKKNFIALGYRKLCSSYLYGGLLREIWYKFML